MSIIISQGGKNAHRLNPSGFAKETRLQKYIQDNPESIPIYEINEDKKLFVIQREFPTNSGPIDALAVDQDGDIYIVETKLFKNSDKRRVVAQVLDYGAALWKYSGTFSSFVKILDNTCQSLWSMKLEDKLMQFFNIDNEQVVLLLNNMEHNLDIGNLKFVILMDDLDERLKDLIVYINQNSRFDVYAVQMEYYKFKDYEIVIPRLYGGEVKKYIDSSSMSSRQARGEKETIEYFKEHLNKSELDIFLRVYDFCKSHKAEIHYGTGSYASFSPIFRKIDGGSLFTLSADQRKRLSINFDWLSDTTSRKLFQELSKIGIVLPENYIRSRPSIEFYGWKDKIDKFLAVIDNMLKTQTTKIKQER